ncbi:MAG: hypothetical protein QF896_04705 [Acidimicrobiales bacterium]|nr:hypothetical protein [Acidimicrobiales bacterium]
MDTGAGDGLDTEVVKSQLLGNALKRGALVARVGDPGLLDGSQPGQRPVDLLPQVQSMVVLAGAAPRAGEWSSPRVEVMETTGTADRISALGNSLARTIEETYGYYAMNVPTTTDGDDRAFLDFRAAAVASGAGTSSLAGPVLHPEHGFLYLAVVLTSLPLGHDGPLTSGVCPAPACSEMWDASGTTPCMDVCPIDRGGCIGGELSQGVLIGRRFDQNRCRDRTYQYWVPGYQAVLERVLDEPDAARRKMMLYGSYFTRTLWSITYSGVAQGQCFECIRACPVGGDRRDLQ